MLQTVKHESYNPNVMSAAASNVEAEAQSQPQAASKKTMQTRFGAVEVSTDNPLIFQQGLLGIAGNTHFALTDFPSEKLAQFKLLQSLTSDKVSFITLPMAAENPLIDVADIDKACIDIGIQNKADMALLLIVSVHRSPDDEVKLSANTRAPVFVHTPTRQAVQYVFQNSKYNVREELVLK